MTISNGNWKNTVITALLTVVLASLAWGFGIGRDVAINKTDISNMKEQFNKIDAKLDRLIEYQRDSK